MVRTPPLIQGNDSVSIEDLLAEAQAAARDSIPENTARAYKDDWKDFQRFCLSHRISALPARPECVCAYLASRAKIHKVATIRRRLTVIGKVHRIRGVENPVDDVRVRQTWLGIRRQNSVPEERKAPALLKDLQAICNGFDLTTLAGIRDKALILLGFAGAMRRSELVALNCDQIQMADDGLVILVRKSKTDQLGAGRKIGIPYGSNPLTCPVKSVFEWMTASGISSDALFRKVNQHGRIEGNRLCAHSVALIVKRAFAAIGKPPLPFSGHSLRAGLATQAAMSGASERSIQNQTGHKNIKVLRTYIRDGSLFRDNAAKKTGL